MAKRTLNKLTALEATKLKTPGRHSDGGGLYLSIDDAGRRRWIFNVRPQRQARGAGARQRP